MTDNAKFGVTRGKATLNRRQFVAASAAVAASALPLAVAPRAAYAAPRRGGHFRFGVGAGETGDTLDPLTGLHNSFTQFTAPSLHNCLTEIDNEGQLQPELATGWDASSDLKTWTIKLRRGVEFHNGKTMTAEDVVASINYHRGLDSKSTVKTIVDQIADVRADGPDTVVFTLAGGNADFAFILSDFRLPVMPSSGGTVDASGVGCGGYVLKRFEPGVRVELERHANYWKSDRAWFDTIEIASITDTGARTNAVVTGEFDAIDRVDLKTVDRLEALADINVVSVTGTQHYTIPMRADTAPFDDNDVRLALKYALDREALLNTILRGYGQVGNDHPIGPSNRYFAADMAQREYDPDRARHHLKKSGRSDLTVQLFASEAAFAGCVDAAVLYQEGARAAGIEIDVVREPVDGYWSNTWMQKPWSFSYWGGRPTEDWMFTTVYAAEASMNEGFWQHERFNALLQEARVTPDGPNRAEMYAELQQIVRDEGSSVIPLFANYVNAFSTSVGHDRMAANWDLDGFRGLERWWFQA